jgi:hypothetical protein
MAASVGRFEERPLWIVHCYWHPRLKAAIRAGRLLLRRAFRISWRKLA